MFGFGIWEIALLLLVLVILFGIGPVRDMASRAFGLYRKVDEAKRSLRDPLNLGDILGRGKKKD